MLHSTYEHNHRIMNTHRHRHTVNRKHTYSLAVYGILTWTSSAIFRTARAHFIRFSELFVAHPVLYTQIYMIAYVKNQIYQFCLYTENREKTILQHHIIIYTSPSNFLRYQMHTCSTYVWKRTWAPRSNIFIYIWMMFAYVYIKSIRAHAFNILNAL